MGKDKDLIAMIPAKLGSTRLRRKNLAMLAGKPLIYYPIRAAKMAGVFNRVIINAEDAVFAKIAKRYGVNFYQRPLGLVASTTKTDVVVYDFLLKNPCDIIVWVSPIAPFQTAGEIRQALDYFSKNKLDSLMTVKNEQVHGVFRNKPINFTIDKPFAQTQNLFPMQLFVYSLMIWRSETFLRAFEKRGSAVLCGRTGYFPVGKLSSIIIKKEEDLALADHVAMAMVKRKRYAVKYDPIITKLRGRGKSE